MPEFKTLFLATMASILVSACSPSEPAPAEPTRETSKTNAKTPPAASKDTTTPQGNEFAGLPAPYNEASYSLGRRTFKLCASCHTVKEGGQNLVGPNLYGIFGRRAGSLPDFKYSDALSNADIVWTPGHVDEWLSNPKSYLPGNNMSFVGVRKPADRTAVIAYLMLESGYETTPPDTSEDP